MPAYPEGGFRLLAHNSTALFLSSLSIASAFPASLAGNEGQSQPSHLVEAPVHPHHTRAAAKLGEVVVRYNHEWQHLRPYETITKPAEPVTDANSVNTSDWRCIKQAEGSNSNGNYTQTSGAFGFLTTSWLDLKNMGFNSAVGYQFPGEAPPSIQDEAALFIYARNGYHFHGSWNDYCTKEGLVN